MILSIETGVIQGEVHFIICTCDYLCMEEYVHLSVLLDPARPSMRA
jgi:hypothetical protein